MSESGYIKQSVDFVGRTPAMISAMGQGTQSVFHDYAANRVGELVKMMAPRPDASNFSARMTAGFDLPIGANGAANASTKQPEAGQTSYLAMLGAGPKQPSGMGKGAPPMTLKP